MILVRQGLSCQTSLTNRKLATRIVTIVAGTGEMDCRTATVLRCRVSVVLS
jgi:hypothetical protein